MFFADSNRSRLRYLAESVWAQTPTAGAPREMRVKTSKLTMKKDTKVSEEIRADRMVPSIIEVGAASEGEIDFEFSAGAHDDFLAAFVYGSWSRPMTFDFWESNVSVASASTFVIASSEDYTPYLTVGRKVKSEGFKALQNNGYFTISGVSFAANKTTVTVSPSTLTAEAASPFAKLFDANDLMVLSTGLRFGTGGAATIDSNGANAFASANAAGQLKIGQKIHVDGLGFETGTVTFGAAAATGETVTLSDGKVQLVFEANAGVSGSVNINFVPGADATASGAALAAVVNAQHAQGNINIVAKSVAGAVTFTNFELVGGSLAASAATAVNFSGGDDSLRGIFTLVGVSDDVLTVSPAPATNDNSGGASIAVKGSMLRNPGRVQDFLPQSFSIETGYEDVNQFFVNKGLRVSQFDLDIQSKSILTGKLQFKGEAMARRQSKTSLFAGGSFTPLDATPGQVASSTTSVGMIVANGQPLATALKSISISGDAGLREQDAVGHKFPVGIGAGRFKLSGKFDAYFEDGTLFDIFVAHSTMSLSFPLTDLDGQHYEFTYPAIKLTSDPLSPGSIDQDVMETIDWEAQRDPATNCMMQVDRFSAIRTPSNLA